MDAASLPHWFEARVQRSYVINFRPRASVLVAMPATLGGMEVVVERVAIMYPHLRLLEVVVFVPAAAAGNGFLEGGAIVPLASPFNPDVDRDPSAANTLPWICDMTYLQLMGHRVRVVDDDDETSGPYRMDGTVFFFTGDEQPGAATGVAYGEHRCYGRLAELAVHSSGAVPASLSEAADYMVIAGVATRARHLVGRLHREIDRAARTIRPKAPWEGMRTSAEVQREAIAMRSELTGRAGFFLASFELQRLYKALSPTFGVPADDLDSFDKSLQRPPGILHQPPRTGDRSIPDAVRDLRTALCAIQPRIRIGFCTGFRQCRAE